MIKETPEPERPRERCLYIGPECLSLRECLALVLGSGPPSKGCMGVAMDVLTRPGSGMSDADQENAFFTAMEVSAKAHLQDLKGLGVAGRAKLLATFEIGKRYAAFREKYRRQPPSKRHSLSRIQKQALTQIDPSLRNASQEWIGFVPYRRSQGVGKLSLVEKGVRTHVNFDVTELFARLLALRPCGFLIFHNHPSGDLTPSDQDHHMTKQIDDLAARFGIKLLGHGIVTPQGEHFIQKSTSYRTVS